MASASRSQAAIPGGAGNRDCAGGAGAGLLGGMEGIIAAGDPITAEAGRFALREGGNAFDAAIAASFASWVAEPVLSSPGGGGFALVAPAGREVHLLDGFAQTPRSRAPEGARFLVEADFGPSRQGFFLGPGTVATPGMVALLGALEAAGSRLPWEVLAAPALDAARRGFRLSRHGARLFRVVRDLYLVNAECRSLFGRAEDPSAPLAEGDHWSNPALADFLEELAAEGPRFFYEGEIARRVAARMAAEGGHLSREDFARYAVVARAPLTYPFSGHTVHGNPPPSLGARFAQLGLSVLERGFVTLPDDPLDPAYPVALGRLQRQLEISWRELADRPELPGPHDPFWDPWKRPTAAPRSVQGTTHLSILDAAGNAVALTVSNGSGSAVLLPDAGFMLNNMLGETDLLEHPEEPEAWPLDTRMASMMSPTLATGGSGTLWVTGSGGSKRIRTTVLQILLRTLHAGQPLEVAVEAPRLHAEAEAWHCEAGWSEAQQAALRALPEAPLLIAHEPENLFFGGAHSVQRDSAGRLHGVGDPRRGGVARRA
jgi:gamma-glutamyltranspeptidase / glutathione hydrolase